MGRYLVNSKIRGKRNRVFNPGTIIEDVDIQQNAIESLVSRGFLKPLDKFEPPVNRKIRLAIVTSIWQRPDVLKMFCKGVEHLARECTDFEISLIVSGSLQDDPVLNDEILENVINNDLLQVLHEFKYIEIPNKPLAAKVNATTYAAQFLNIDYVLCLGSDDVVHPDLLNEYAKYMRKGVDFIGVTDFYFYDTTSKRSLYWGGYQEQYRKNHTAGAARALSARLLNKWDWSPWEVKDSHVLDKSMQDKMKVTPHTIHVFSMRSKGLFALDIKSSTNMTPFHKWDNSDFIENQVIFDKFKYLF